VPARACVIKGIRPKIKNYPQVDCPGMFYGKTTWGKNRPGVYNKRDKKGHKKNPEHIVCSGFLV